MNKKDYEEIKDLARSNIFSREEVTEAEAMIKESNLGPVVKDTLLYDLYRRVHDSYGQYHSQEEKGLLRRMSYSTTSVERHMKQHLHYMKNRELPFSKENMQISYVYCCELTARTMHTFMPDWDGLLLTYIAVIGGHYFHHERTRFPNGGKMFMMSTGNPSSLRSTMIKRVLFDETSHMPVDRCKHFGFAHQYGKTQSLKEWASQGENIHNKIEYDTKMVKAGIDRFKADIDRFKAGEALKRIMLKLEETKMVNKYQGKAMEVIGLPEHKKEEFNKSLKYIKSLNLNVKILRVVFNWKGNELNTRLTLKDERQCHLTKINGNYADGLLFSVLRAQSKEIKCS